MVGGLHAVASQIIINNPDNNIEQLLNIYRSIYTQ